MSLGISVSSDPAFRSSLGTASVSCAATLQTLTSLLHSIGTCGQLAPKRLSTWVKRVQHSGPGLQAENLQDGAEPLPWGFRSGRGCGLQRQLV